MEIAYLALLVRIFLLGIEKIVVKKLGTEKEEEATFLFFFLATILFVPIWLCKAPSTSLTTIALISIPGFVYSIAFLFYVKSLAKGEVSLVSPIYNFNAFFLVIAASIFLKEPITAYKILGILLLVYGASFLNRQTNIFSSLKELLKNSSCRDMLICSLLMAVGRTIDGLLIRKLDPLAYTFWLYFMISLFLSLHVFYKQKIASTIELLKTKPYISITAGFINAYSYYFLLVAFTKIQVSIAEPASMLSMVVTAVLAKFILKEKIKRG